MTWLYINLPSPLTPGEPVEDQSMGILVKQVDSNVVIMSDHTADGLSLKRAPRARLEGNFYWTGSAWSLFLVEALRFDNETAADEYMERQVARLLPDRR